MFDKAVIIAVHGIAARLNVPTAHLLAVAEVESDGVPYAEIAGRNEPLIRFEGHHFDKRLGPEQRAAARKAGLADPKVGGVKNPTSQAKRWDMLNAAMAINRRAALESTSWGVGQVMGFNWNMLGYGSVDEMVAVVRADLGGQIDVMSRFIDKSGLAGALRAGRWATFARGYNGPGYAANKYDTKMAKAADKWADETTPSDRSVLRLQQRLNVHGAKPPLREDGVRGDKTTAALEAFQKRHRLEVDGIAGGMTWAALDKEPG